MGQQEVGKIVQAVETAVVRSRGAAIVNVGELATTQEEIASGLPPRFYLTTVAEILEDQWPLIPVEKTGMIVTGYSALFYEDPSQERMIEAFVRREATTRVTRGETFHLVVLSDSLPNIHVFKNPSLPWWNGPFRGEDNPVWAIRSSGGDIQLVKHSVEWIRDALPVLGANRRGSWVEQQTYTF